MKSITIGFVGTGNMAGAIIGGITRKGILAADSIGVFDVNEEKMQEYGQKGFVAFSSIEALVEACQYIVLSVKPQVFPAVLPLIKEKMTADKVLISIAAGITDAYIKEQIGFDCSLIMAMPNTPMMVGEGASILSRRPPVKEEDFAFVRSIFASAGVVEEIDPSLMKEVIPVNSSSPAFVYEFARVVVKKAVEKGFDADVANRLFCQTLIGSAQMMLESSKSHQELIDMVCSPGGTTLKGMEALKLCGFEEAVSKAFDDTIARAYELQDEKK